MANTAETVKSVDTNTRQVVTVKVGNISVRVLPTIKAGREYWLVEDYSQGRRRLLNAKNLPAARARAKLVAKSITTSTKELANYDQSDFISYERAEEAVTPHGKFVDEAAREWAEAMDALKGRGSIMDAVRFFVSNGGTNMTPKTVAAATEELLTLKQAQGMSLSHLLSTKQRLNKFKAVFGESELHTLTLAQIENFIVGLNLSGTSQNHFRKSIANLYTFAQSRAYVPKDFNPGKAVRKAKVEEHEVQYFKPEEVKKLIAACVDELEDHLPLVLLCGFAGLRPSEAARVTWQMVSDDFIRLPGNATKTGKARMVPISDNLKLWLAPLRQKAGLVLSSLVNPDKAAGKLKKASGVAWVDDGLRHAFGTYRQAMIKNIGQIADEMGNTIPVARRHYVNPMVTKEEGEAWFAIKPEGTEKVTLLTGTL